MLFHKLIPMLQLLVGHVLFPTVSPQHICRPVTLLLRIFLSWLCCVRILKVNEVMPRQSSPFLPSFLRSLGATDALYCLGYPLKPPQNHSTNNSTSTEGAGTGTAVTVTSCYCGRRFTVLISGTKTERSCFLIKGQKILIALYLQSPRLYQRAARLSICFLTLQRTIRRT